MSSRCHYLDDAIDVRDATLKEGAFVLHVDHVDLGGEGLGRDGHGESTGEYSAEHGRSVGRQRAEKKRVGEETWSRGIGAGRDCKIAPLQATPRRVPARLLVEGE